MSDFYPSFGGFGWVHPPNNPGAIGFDPQDYTKSASDTSVALTVVRTGDISRAVTALWLTVDGTATAGDEYTAASGSLSWAAGDDTSRTVTVPLRSGSTYPSAFTVELAEVVNAAAVSNPATVSLISVPTITDVIIASQDTAYIADSVDVAPGGALPPNTELLPFTYVANDVLGFYPLDTWTIIVDCANGTLPLTLTGVDPSGEYTVTELSQPSARQFYMYVVCNDASPTATQRTITFTVTDANGQTGTYSIKVVDTF